MLSSYSGVIILAIAALIILPVSYITWYHNQILIADYKDTLVTLGNIYLKVKSFSLDINASTIEWRDNKTLCFWVLNSGAASISVNDFTYIDVILTYNTSDGETITIWVPYNPTGNPGIEIFWRIEGVKVGSKNVEIVNPIYPSPYYVGSKPASGKWDPGEELLFVIYLTPEYSANTTCPVAIYISLKCGVYDYVSGVSS